MKTRFFAAVTFWMTATPVTAAFVIQFPANAAVNAGTTGNYFDVVLANSGMTPIGPFAVDSFNMQLTVPTSSGITFTGVTASTSAPYLFAGNSFGLLSVPAVNQIDWNDLTALPPAMVPPGGIFGLGRVYYDVSVSSPIGAVPITVQGITTFSDFPTFNAIPYTSNAGTLTVVTPAPPTVWFGVIGFVLLGLQTGRSRIGL